MDETRYRFISGHQYSTHQYCVFGEHGGNWTALNMYETDQCLVIVAELAGVRLETLSVEVASDRVHIQGIRQVDPPAGLVRIHRLEIAAGPFDIQVPLHVAVDTENVTSRFENGLLEVVLPLLKHPPQRIAITTEGGDK